MVRVATHWPHERPHPDPIRILAISASIALNLAALGLLLRPPEFTLPAAPTDPMTMYPIDPVHPKQPDPKPLPAKPHTQPVHPQTQLVQRHDPVITPTANPMSTDPVITTTTTDPIVPPTTLQPVEASLTPTTAPAPIYPRDALRDGITGTVELELLVGADGRVIEVHVVHSSGNRYLDSAARDQVLRNWRFLPAMRDGVAVPALGRVPIVFRLDGQ